MAYQPQHPVAPRLPEVMFREDVVEKDFDPAPNAHLDHATGVLNVYHGFVYGDRHTRITPVSIGSEGLLAPLRPQVLWVRDTMETPMDPPPNAFVDHSYLFVRVYHETRYEPDGRPLFTPEIRHAGLPVPPFVPGMSIYGQPFYGPAFAMPNPTHHAVVNSGINPFLGVRPIGLNHDNGNHDRARQGTCRDDDGGRDENARNGENFRRSHGNNMHTSEIAGIEDWNWPSPAYQARHQNERSAWRIPGEWNGQDDTGMSEQQNSAHSAGKNVTPLRDALNNWHSSTVTTPRVSSQWPPPSNDSWG